MKQIPIAVQVYSVRQEAEADFAGTMKRLAQMGYDGVELAGLYGKTAEEIGTVLKENGLTAVSAHVPVEEFEKDLEGTLDTYAVLGCKWLAIPWLGEDRRFGAERYEETLKLISKDPGGSLSSGSALSGRTGGCAGNGIGYVLGDRWRGRTLWLSEKICRTLSSRSYERFPPGEWRGCSCSSW